MVPEGDSWPEGHRSDVVHEVDMSVELVMADGVVLGFPWAMDGVKEGLAVELREKASPGREVAEDAVDVGGIREWGPFLGHSISGAAIAWHVPHEDVPEVPWSFRLDFANSASVVIALGEADSSKVSGLTYMPDSLVVVFDLNLASSYRIPSSTVSAVASN